MIKESLIKNKNILAVCLFLFLLGIPIGYLSYGLIADKVLPVIQSIAAEIQGKSQLETVLAIFLNNYRVCVILTLAGIFIIPALGIVMLNGFIIGFVAKLLQNENLGILYLIKGIALHGIFELPAIFISAAIGIRIGLSLLTFDFSKMKKNASQSIREAIVVHFLVVVPLLIIAAFIEVFISAALILGKTI